jgi:UDP-glucose 4-epimerase
LRRVPSASEARALKRNVLVTGGAGFIGSALVRALIDHGDTVVVVDNLSTGKRANIPPRAGFIELDLSRADFVGVLPQGSFDAVCHLAAQSSGELSGADPLYDVQTNALSTLLLSRWCLRNGVPRFVYASSMAIYGDPRQLPVEESAQCEPLSIYGISKLASENYLRLASRDGLSSTSLRMFSVYGPGQNMENLKQGMASIFMAYMMRGAEVPVTGSLERFRDFVYIDDVVDAWLKTLALPATPSATYNVGSGSPVTVRELLDRLLSALQLPAQYPVRERPGLNSDQFGLYADVERIRRELDWTPRTNLASGLRLMADWVRGGMRRGG